MTKLSSMAGLDGWQNSSTPTGESGTPSEHEGKWDPATVIGLKSTDEVLVIGNAAFMPWLTEICRDVSSVKKVGELQALVNEGEQFNKVIISREVSFTAEMIPYCGPLLKHDEAESGFLVVFAPDDGWSIEQAVEFYYPEARTWQYDTMFGHVFIAETHGVSWRFANG